MSDTSTQEQQPPAGSETPPPAADQGTEKPGTDHSAEVEKWKALARENEKRAKANAEAARKLAEMEERDKTEAQKLIERAEKAEKEAAEARLESLRASIALEKNLPPKLAGRLQGSTAAEMRADADDLLAEIGAAKKTGPSFGGGAGSAPPPADDMNARLRRAAGRE